METKITANVSHFSTQNTPPFIEKLGNILLLIGSAGAIVATLPLSAPVVTTVSAIIAAAGAVGKIITKFFGTVDTNGNPVSNLPSNQSNP